MPARPTELPWREFAPILAVHFLGTLGFSLAIPFLVFIVSDLGGASWAYGLLGATYSAAQLLGAPVLGRWSDRWGRRPVLVASQIGTLAAWLLFLFALSLPNSVGLSLSGIEIAIPLLLVFAARAIDGLTGGNVSVANAYVADLTRETPDLRDRAFGRMGMAASLGFVIGPAAAGILGGTEWGPRLPVAVAAVFALLTTLAILFGLKEPRARCPKGAPHPDAFASTLQQQTKRCDRESPRVLRDCPWANPRVISVLLGSFLLFLGFNFFYSSFPVHATRFYGWTEGQLGTFFALLSGVMIFAQGPLLQFATKRLGRRTIFRIGIASLAMALLVLQLPSPEAAYGAAFFFALGNGLAWPTFQGRVAEVAGDTQGTVQGASASAGSLASILGLILGALLYPQLGRYVFGLGFTMFVVVLALTPVWFGREASSRSKV